VTRVEVYGANHSPWVQAVLLGLHEKQIPYTITGVPPWETFKECGVLMPAARLDGKHWQFQSAEILSNLGYETVNEQDMAAVRGAWVGVLHRVDSPFGFIRAFSLAGDSHPSTPIRMVRNYFRSFPSFYFFSLLNFLRLSGSAPADPDNFGDQFIYWEDRLAAGGESFLCGSEPGALDCLLFGIIQCHSSIEVPPIKALQEDPRLERLRGWIAAMQLRFADYPFLYSGLYFKPHLPAPQPAGGLEQLSFLLGFISMVVLLPITLPLVLFLRWRLSKGRG
jgi:glutathione S-transferase